MDTKRIYREKEFTLKLDNFEDNDGILIQLSVPEIS